MVIKTGKCEKKILTAYELMYGRPVPSMEKEGPLSPYEMEQLRYALQVGEAMKALTAYGNQVLPAPTDLMLYPF